MNLNNISRSIDIRALQKQKSRLEAARRSEAAGKQRVLQLLARRGHKELATRAEEACAAFEHHGFRWVRKWSDMMAAPERMFGNHSVLLRVSSVRTTSSKLLSSYRVPDDEDSEERQERYNFSGFNDARDFVANLPGLAHAVQTLVAPDCYVGWACARGEHASIICVAKGPVVDDSYSEWYGRSVREVTDFKDALGLPDWFDVRNDSMHTGSSAPSAINEGLIGRSLASIEAGWWQRLAYTGVNVVRIQDEQAAAEAEEEANEVEKGDEKETETENGNGKEKMNEEQKEKMKENENDRKHKTHSLLLPPVSLKETFKMLKNFAIQLEQSIKQAPDSRPVLPLGSMRVVAELYTALSENCIMGREFGMSLILTGNGIRDMFADPADVLTMDSSLVRGLHYPPPRPRVARQTGGEICASTPIPWDLLLLTAAVVAGSFAVAIVPQSISLADAMQIVPSVAAAGFGLVLGLYKTWRYGDWPYRDLLRLRYRARSLSELSEGLGSRRAALNAMAAVLPAERRYAGPYDCLVSRIAGARGLPGYGDGDGDGDGGGGGGHASDGGDGMENGDREGSPALVRNEDFFLVDMPTMLSPFALHGEIRLHADKLGHIIVHVGQRRMSIRLPQGQCAHLVDEVANSTSFEHEKYITDLEVGFSPSQIVPEMEIGPPHPDYRSGKWLDSEKHKHCPHIHL